MSATVSTTNTSSPNKWIILGTVMFGTFMSTLDSSIVNIALPTIRRALAAGDSVEWIVLCYLLTTTSTLLIMGKLSDWVGRRQLYITGFCVFVLGSLLCGLAWSLWSLVGFRVVQGLGAAMITPLGGHHRRRIFAERARAGTWLYGLSCGGRFQRRTGDWWITFRQIWLDEHFLG